MGGPPQALSDERARRHGADRGAQKVPGDVRRSQHWIGGSRARRAVFVPSPPSALREVRPAFEHYLHACDDLPAVVRAGLLHVQVERITPDLDGNGRIGRLLGRSSASTGAS